MDFAFGIIWIILAFNIGYMSLFALLGLFYPRESYPVRNEKLKFCVFIPAYKGDEVILNTAEETLKQNYPQDKFDVVVIADSLKKETIQILQQMKLYVVEVNFENSTKGKSLNAALAVVGNKDYDYAVVLDIDNIIEPLSLEKINSALAKGQFVLQAFSILKASGKLPCKLLMLDINRGYLQNLAQEIGDPSIVDEITFTGFVPNQELPAIYSRATLFLYPLLRESFGIPLVEAMRCEVPVIPSNASSMPDIVDNAALICNPFNPNSITNAIFDLWNNPTLQSTLRNKGKLRGDFFSWKQNAPDTLAIYQSIIQ